MIKYSILVPVYNVEEYLPKCVDSIIAQDYQSEDYEVILVDDGSTDSSGRICDSYSEKHDNIAVIHQENRGLLLARCSGVKNSSGKYLVFIDSDDYVDPDYLSVIDKYVDSFDPDFMVHGYIEELNTGSGRCPVTQEEYEKLNKLEFLDRFVRTDSLNSIWNKVVRADIFRDRVEEVYGFSTNIGEDKLQTAFLIKYSENIVFLGACPYHYILRDSSIAHTKSEEDIHKMILVFDRVGEIISGIVESEGLSGEKADRIMSSYNAVALSGILDHIYKYNKRNDVPATDKCAALERIFTQNTVFFDDKSPVIKDLKLYNRVRFDLISGRRYSSLIRLDRLLKKIQRITGI